MQDRDGTCRGRPEARVLARARVLLGLALYLTTALPPAAQTITGSAQTPAPRLALPATIAGAEATQIQLSIELGPTDVLPPKSFVRIRGLPSAVSLTEGYSIAPGAWAVPLHALAGLAANLPAGQVGQSVVTIQLVGMDGTLLAQAQTVLVIAPAFGVQQGVQQGGVQTNTGPGLQAETKPRGPELSAEDRQRAEKMLAQGEKYLESGNIAVARQFFQRAADAGLAAGALQLAATYDAHELGRLAAKGVVASPEEARKWYRRARELGAREADERLARLDGK